MDPHPRRTRWLRHLDDLRRGLGRPSLGPPWWMIFMVVGPLALCVVLGRDPGPGADYMLEVLRIIIPWA